MINPEKAYILGLFVGNGTLAKNTFFIKFPFKKWGMDPQKMSLIARDILIKISDKFNKSYGITVAYDILADHWLVKPLENLDLTPLKNDLSTLGLATDGFLLNQSDLSKAKTLLKGLTLENFLTGIFDVRCSLTKSHRRFENTAPIASLEVPGSTQNFNFIKDICSLLNDLGTTTDQILYNHPNQHSASDPNYKSWKKGFKIRFLVNSFLAQNSFALTAKAIDIGQLKSAQKKKEQKPCLQRKLGRVTPVSIHSDLNSNELPTEVKGKLFFHYHHYCAVLGCQYAPVNEVKRLVSNYKDHIFALPRIQKGNFKEIELEYLSLVKKHLINAKIKSKSISVESALKNKDFKQYLELENALAYLFSPILKGKRPGQKGPILEGNKKDFLKLYEVQSGSLPPLLMVNLKNDRAVLISAQKSSLNRDLIDKHVSVKGLAVEVQ